ncbi:hypothetical protein K466DRAFT_438439, partial [Polyporus arcularius HHB13444]
FPSRSKPRPGPVVMPDGIEEYEVERILDHRCRVHGYQFLMCWHGWGPDADRWLAGAQ